MSDRDVVLTPESARRVANAVKAVERMTRGSAPPPSMPRIIQSARYAVVTEAIGAGDQSAKTLGSGKAKLQLAKATTSGGTTTYGYADLPGADAVVVLSGASASIDVGRLIVVEVIDGFYSVVVDFCS